SRPKTEYFLWVLTGANASVTAFHTARPGRVQKVRHRLVPLAAIEQLETYLGLPVDGVHALNAADQKVIVPFDSHDLSMNHRLVHRDAHPGSREIPDLAVHRHIRVAQDGSLAVFVCFNSVLR